MSGIERHGKLSDVSRWMSFHDASLYETHIFSGGKFSVQTKGWCGINVLAMKQASCV